MLKLLTIDNYALIEHTEIEFGDGFSVVTGETGAGKSIMLGALGMLIGQKTDISAMKDPQKKCVAEAVFAIDGYNLQGFFAGNDLDYEPECTIRREILPSGKSRAFVNDTPVNLSVMKELGARLIDIHSQHQNLLLSNANFQLDVIDEVAKTQPEKNNYQQLYAQYRRTLAQLKQLQQQAEQDEKDVEFMQFQHDQIDKAALKDGEQAELEAEQNMLENAESIKEALGQSSQLLQDGETNILTAIKGCIDSLSGIENAYPQISGEKKRLESLLIEAKDISREIEGQLDTVEADPQRLTMVAERLDTIYSLERKHKVDTIEQLLTLKDELSARLAQITRADDDIAKLKKTAEQEKLQLQKLAETLSEKRKSNAPAIEKQLGALLHSLGMPNAKLEVQFQAVPFGESGTDSVSFLFSANKDHNMQPIASIASGGEMSRVMLGLKSILSQTREMPTVIFDEIDTGVSGDMAAKMGSIMQQMGQRMQVISITHLPQIAAKGNTHYMVYKTDTDTTTVSRIKRLTEEERVQAVARMLSGDKISQAAMDNARELLSQN